MFVFLNILTVLLLALVAGLLLAVGQQVRVWRQVMAQSPLLAEQLAMQLLSARQGLEHLRAGLMQQGPELTRLTSDAGKLRTDLQYLLEKADQAAARMDMKLHPPTESAKSARLPKVQGAVVEQVAGANGHAIQPSQPSHDPLEDLLAGLQAVPAAATSIRRGPVTKAELTLAQRVKGA
jgi:hypothetical protein